MLTGATLIFLPKPAIAFQADVVVVNRAAVGMAGMLPPTPTAARP